MSEPRCRVCNVPLAEHLGLYGLCDHNQRLSAAARELIAACRVVLRDGETEATRRDLAWRVHCCEIYAHEPSKAAAEPGEPDDE